MTLPATNAPSREQHALDFLQTLWRLNHSLEQLSSRMHRHLGITAQQRLMIRFIGKYPGITAGELARQLHLDPGTISTALGRLAGRRLIVRRKDPGDARRIILGLTAAGHEIDRPIDGTVEHAVSRLLDLAGKVTVADARNVLTTLSQLLEAERPA
jgi:MarR family transcriptional regulator, organic hydroperoxide resistance regulator